MGSVVFVDDAYIAGVTALRSVNLSEVNFMIWTGTTTPSLRKKLVRAFSPPLTPSFDRTGDNALLLTAFALAFSPVSPLSVAAFAALRVSFPGACPGKDGFFILTKRQRVIASLNPFSLRATLSFSRYVFAERKRIYYKKERGAALAKVKYY